MRRQARKNPEITQMLDERAMPRVSEEAASEGYIRDTENAKEEAENKPLTNESSHDTMGEAGTAVSRRENVKLTEPSMPKGSKPSGEYARIPNSKDAVSYILQNEAADILANAGYEVHMLKEVKGGNGFGLLPDKNPDFLIGRYVFDCYSPMFASARNVYSNVQKKTFEQASRVILNLNRYHLSIEELYKQFKTYRLDTMDELFVIIDGKITRWFP